MDFPLYWNGWPLSPDSMSTPWFLALCQPSPLLYRCSLLIPHTHLLVTSKGELRGHFTWISLPVASQDCQQGWISWGHLCSEVGGPFRHNSVSLP